MVNYARFLNIDPDEAAGTANRKFIQRFHSWNAKAQGGKVMGDDLGRNGRVLGKGEGGVRFIV